MFCGVFLYPVNMSNDAILSNMLSSKLFLGLQIEQMELLFRLAEFKIYPASNVVVRENDAANKFFWVETGRLTVEILQSNGHENLLVYTLKRGELFGEMSLLGMEKRTATVTAKNDCHLYLWNSMECLKFFEANKEIGFLVMKNLAAILGSRIRDMNLMLRSYAERLEPGIPYFD